MRRFHMCWSFSRSLQVGFFQSANFRSWLQCCSECCSPRSRKHCDRSFIVVKWWRWVLSVWKLLRGNILQNKLLGSFRAGWRASTYKPHIVFFQSFSLVPSKNSGSSQFSVQVDFNLSVLRNSQSGPGIWDDPLLGGKKIWAKGNSNHEATFNYRVSIMEGLSITEPSNSDSLDISLVPDFQRRIWGFWWMQKCWRMQMCWSFFGQWDHTMKMDLWRHGLTWTAAQKRGWRRLKLR